MTRIVSSRILSDTRYVCPAKLVTWACDVVYSEVKGADFVLFCFFPVGMGHGPFRVLSYRTPIHVSGPMWISMTYRAVSPSCRIGYGVSEVVGAVSCNYVVITRYSKCGFGQTNL